ncbi:hypothetical protein OIDMADRAFT_142790 [Oidiodendron maius Zn]|uniref:Enoyl reductase (ER) domain-containing protein n=1 Tax=Oidiodendron maius (strain Zn) TaxID=913774 RepID=A0A0C3D181_OIDMZ|nr:hypothetical protein OIDMADRAFT_142790 [Oidiodendron maius Zn]
MPPQNIKYLARGVGARLEATVSPKPTILEPTEVIIRLRAIAINPADCKMIDLGHRVTSWPRVPGLDGAGVIEDVGDRVKNFAVGDEVLAMFFPGDRNASFQSFAVVQETMLAKKPATWSFENAATLGVCYLTGIIGLGIGLGMGLPFLKDGLATSFNLSSVLVIGGSSALGAAVIQLLRLAVPQCIVLATSSPKHHGHLTTALGANIAFDRNSSSLVTEVKSASPGSRGVDAIIDAVGAGRTERHIFETFDSNGPKKYAQVWTGDDEIEVPSGVVSVMFRGRDLPQLQGNQNVFLALQALLEEDKYKLPLPVHKVGDGFNMLEKGLDLMRKGVSGEKLVISV